MDDPDTPSRGERTRQVILDAACALFLEHGYHGTSMRQIAGRAGLALGGIYNHFSGKEDIFRILLFERHPYHQVLPRLLEMPADDPETFVRQAAHAILTELDRRPDFVRLMLIELVEFNGRDMPAVVERVLPQVLPLIRRVGRRGRLRRIPPLIMFRAFLGFFFSYHLTGMVIAGTPAAMTQKNALDHFVEIFLHGILAGEARA